MAVKGMKNRYWEMQTAAGPYDDAGPQQMFKCTTCGAETHPDEGWNGEPNPHHCHHDCQMDHGDWNAGGGDKLAYRRNFDRIFPNAPGAGL